MTAVSERLIARAIERSGDRRADPVSTGFTMLCGMYLEQGDRIAELEAELATLRPPTTEDTPS